MATPLALGSRYGSLVVGRIQPDGLIFCLCDCGGSREVKRAALTSRSIHQCYACGRASRARQNRPPDPPKTELVKIELPPCVGCKLVVVDHRLMMASQPDCPRHGLSGVNLGWPPRREREAIIGWVE